MDPYKVILHCEKEDLKHPVLQQIVRETFPDMDELQNEHDEVNMIRNWYRVLR
jgi:hypothetical protein